MPTTIPSTSLPLIPSELLGALRFNAPMWGIRQQSIAGDPKAVWVTLCVDLGVQVSVKILTSVDTAPALSERAMRQFTLRHSPEGIVIEQIRTDGLGYAEASGWSVAVSASA
ncbi:MAG TPA: hypothetical protein PKV96_01905 [Candidatus Saccharimonas sp.]|jgi:hypothetical protein|nr:hypothetical protein [Candidatus Saccharimonas sp.]